MVHFSQYSALLILLGASIALTRIQTPINSTIASISPVAKPTVSRYGVGFPVLIDKYPSAEKSVTKRPTREK